MKIGASNSLFLDGMQDSIMPIALAHGEGRAIFTGNPNKHNQPWAHDTEQTKQ